MYDKIITTLIYSFLVAQRTTANGRPPIGPSLQLDFDASSGLADAKSCI
jgi:hypothetical protein